MFDQDPNEQARISASDFEQMCDQMRDLKQLNTELLEALETTLILARLKWGNLDKDANVIFDSARAAIAKAKSSQ